MYPVCGVKLITVFAKTSILDALSGSEYDRVQTAPGNVLCHHCVTICVTISLILTFHITKSENRTKKSLNSAHTIALSKHTIFARNADFLQKNANISKIKKVPVLKSVFSDSTYMCVLMYQISSS